jgi:hypothetical protein
VFTEQFSKDLTDGRLDHFAADQSSAFSGQVPSYLTDQMAIQVRTDIGSSVGRLGGTVLKSLGASVIKRSQFKSIDRRSSKISGNLIYTDGDIRLTGDGVIVANDVASDGRIEWRSPANLEFTNFILIPPTFGKAPIPTPGAEVIGVAKDGSIWNSSWTSKSWALVLDKSAGIIAAANGEISPFSAPAKILLHSDGRLLGPVIKNIIPDYNQRKFESITPIPGNWVLVIDRDRKIFALSPIFLENEGLYASPSIRFSGRFFEILGLGDIKARSIGGSISISAPLFVTRPSLDEGAASISGELLVLDMNGNVWRGSPRSTLSQTTPARMIEGTGGNCGLGGWLVLGCDGTVSSLVKPGTITKINSLDMPELSNIVSISPELTNQSNISHAISANGCVYEITHSINTLSTWMIRLGEVDLNREICLRQGGTYPVVIQAQN